MMNTRPDEIAVTHVSLDTGRVELTKGEVGHGLDAFVIEGLVNEEECGALIKARAPPPTLDSSTSIWIRQLEPLTT